MLEVRVIIRALAKVFHDWGRYAWSAEQGINIPSRIHKRDGTVRLLQWFDFAEFEKHGYVKRMAAQQERVGRPFHSYSLGHSTGWPPVMRPNLGSALVNDLGCLTNPSGQPPRKSRGDHRERCPFFRLRFESRNKFTSTYTRKIIAAIQSPKKTRVAILALSRAPPYWPFRRR